MSNYGFDAVIFDLDGVITKTADVHSTAWKEMFDTYLRYREEKYGETFREFTKEGDYLPYVDGKPRYKGVADFLTSRNIEIPFGDPSDSTELETACGLGNRKNDSFNAILDRDGVERFESTVALIHELKKKGLRVGVASSSKNCEVVLKAAELDHLMETRVDGVVSVELGLNGKPEADIFTTAADNLGVDYDRTVVVEDAVSGVQAGAAGNFGLVLGLARENNHEELAKNGADIVVDDIEEFGFDEIVKWFEEDKAEDAWWVSYTGFEAKKEKTRESLTTIGNGFFGTRGCQEEAADNGTNYPGTYIASLYNRLDSKVGDRFLANEDFVNAPNWLPITFKVDDGEYFDFAKGNFRDYNKELYLRYGVVSRSIVVTDDNGRETLIESDRFASMANPHLGGLNYNITPLNYSGRITVKAGIDGDVINGGVERYKQLEQNHLEPVTQGGEGSEAYVSVRTVQSAIEIAEVQRLAVFANHEPIQPEYTTETESAKAFTTFTVPVEKDSTLVVQKNIAIYTSHTFDTENPLQSARNAVKENTDYDQNLMDSESEWENIWSAVDVEVEGDRKSQLLLRLHNYHLQVGASTHNQNLDASFTARGLHGEAYRGHIFWDELFILPHYNMHQPEVSRSLLMYRYNRLEEARKYAQQHNFAGAMFPWQSGSDGREETQVLHLNPISGKWGDDYSSLQRHVSLAIGYNVWQYYNTTNDLEFIEKYGAEMFFEICRFWASKAYKGDNERYSIKNVMGPDEFHEKYPNSTEGGLKDNTYTNLMVVWSMRRAKDLAEAMSEEAKATIFDKIDLTGEELGYWKEISENMNIVIQDDILAQYDGYFDLKELDWDAYREKYKNIYRMDRILKSEGKSADDYKVAKQADTLMTFYNLDKEEVTGMLRDLSYELPEDYLTKNLEYYLARTSHGSTLSRVVHAQLGLMVNNMELSWGLYSQALASDFTDIQGGTTAEGIHSGVMAGTIMIALSAYAGVDTRGSVLRVKPQLPKAWKSIRFNMVFKGVRFWFQIDHNSVRVKADKEAKIIVNEFAGSVTENWMTVEV